MTYHELERVQGPACPGCGCTDAKLESMGTRWGRPEGRYVCQHCGRRYPATPPEAEPPQQPAPEVPRYPGARCPSCGSRDVPVTSSRTPIRHHKCRACGVRFKSVDVDA